MKDWRYSGYTLDIKLHKFLVEFDFELNSSVLLLSFFFFYLLSLSFFLFFSFSSTKHWRRRSHENTAVSAMFNASISQALMSRDTAFIFCFLFPRVRRIGNITVMV